MSAKVPAASTGAAMHDARGVELFQLGRVQDAIACFREAIRLEPGCATSHYNLGNALAAGPA
jgi:tetratricopeptide (TPR) repeat protein